MELTLGRNNSLMQRWLLC